MLEANAKIFLPISADTLRSVIFGENKLIPIGSNVSKQSTNGLIAAVTKLAIHETASLFFLQHLSQLKPSNSDAVERLLAECLKVCQHLRVNASEEEFQTTCFQQLSLENIRSGYWLLPVYKVALLDDHTLAERTFLDGAGNWNYDFCTRHQQELRKDLQEVKVNSLTLHLSAEQSRIYRELLAGQDEHIHIQGYAGTGKTTLIKSLLSLLGEKNTKVLVLAERKAQLDVFSAIAVDPNRVQLFTYTDLAKLIIAENSTELGEETILRKGITRTTMPDKEIIQHLGLKDSSSAKALQLVKAVRATLFRYCQSGDDDVSVKHIPRNYQAMLDTATQAAVSQYTYRLWCSILSPPTKDFTPQIRAYHIIKWAALNRCVIPSEFSHVLIDECHDLPTPVNQILSNSSQARISLGDDYQNLHGHIAKQPVLIRQREMHHSLRSSHQLDSMLNPIISVHPSQVNATFYGNRMNRLDLEYYEKATVPSNPTLILVKDFWGLFEWAQRMAAGQLKIKLLSNGVALDTFVQDCIELYYNGTQARHGELFRFTSWGHLATFYRDNPAFQRVTRMLEKNYSQQDWQLTQRFIVDKGRDVYPLALIDNVRNLEFDNVMITPQMVSISRQSVQDSPKNQNRVNTISNQSANRKNNAQEASFYAQVYVAITRARKRLIVPEQLRNHIEEIS